MQVMLLDKHVICLTGAFGFIGLHLIPQLLRRGASVRVLTRSLERGVMDGVEIYVGDMFEPDSLTPFLEGAGLLINLAHPSGELSDERYTQGIGNLAKAAKHAGVQRVLHISTAMVIGVSLQKVVTEATPERPVTSYERQKLSAEKKFQLELQGRVDLGILRPTAVFGVGGKNLLKLACTVTSGHPLLRGVYRFVHGRRHMHLVSVDDVVAAIIFLSFIEKALDGNVFLISADDEPANCYQTVDSIFGSTVGKPLLTNSLCMPNFLLSTFLKLAGRSQANPTMIYDSGKLESWGFRRTANFKLELQRFAENYQAERCAS